MNNEPKYENGKKEYVAISTDLMDLYDNHSIVALNVMAMTDLKNLKFSEDEQKGLAYNISCVNEYFNVLVNFRKEISKYEDKNNIDEELKMWEENNAKIRYNFHVKTIKEYRSNELFANNIDVLSKYDERLKDYFANERITRKLIESRDNIFVDVAPMKSHLRRN